MVTQMLGPRLGDSLFSLEYGKSAAVTDVSPLPGQMAIEANASVGPFVDLNMVVLSALVSFFLLYVAIVVFEELSERVPVKDDDPAEPLGRS